MSLEAVQATAIVVALVLVVCSDPGVVGAVVSLQAEVAALSGAGTEWLPAASNASTVSV